MPGPLEEECGILACNGILAAQQSGSYFSFLLLQSKAAVKDAGCMEKYGFMSFSTSLHLFLNYIWHIIKTFLELSM